MKKLFLALSILVAAVGISKADLIQGTFPPSSSGGGSGSLPLPGGATNYVQINPTATQTGAFKVSSGSVVGPFTTIRVSTFTSSVFLDPTSIYSSLTPTINAANSEPASVVGFLFNPNSNLSAGSDADGVVGLSEDTTAGNIQLFGVRGIDYVQGTAPQYVGTDGLVRWWSSLPGGTTSQIVGMLAEVDIAQADGVTPRSTGTVINLLIPNPNHGSGAPNSTWAVFASSTYSWFVNGKIGIATSGPTFGLDNQDSTGERVLYGLTAGSVTVNGAGNGIVTLTVGNSTYTVTYTSGPVTTGQVAVFSSTSGAVISAPVSAVLPSNVALTNANQTFTGVNTFNSSVTVNNGEFNTGSILVSTNSNGAGIPAGTILRALSGNDNVIITSNAVHIAGSFSTTNLDTTPLFSNETGHYIGALGIVADSTSSYNLGLGVEGRTNSHGQAPHYDALLGLATWSQQSFKGSSSTIIAADLREEMTSDGSTAISSGGVVGLVLRQPIGSGAAGQTWSFLGMNSNPYAIGGSLLITPVTNSVFGIPINPWPAVPSFRLQVNETTVNTNAAIFVSTGTSNPTLTLQNTHTQGHQLFSFAGDNQTYYLGSGNSVESLLGVPNKFVLYDATAGAVRWATDTSGNTIFGGTTAAARLQVSGGTNKLTMAVSTGAAGPYVLYVSSFGAGSVGFEDKTSSPVLTSCGTSPIITGTNNAFQITGGGGATGCVATFTPGTFVKKPHCTISEQTPSLTNLTTYSYTTAAITISEVGFAGNIVDVVCFGSD